MKLFKKMKDGGAESTVTGYWLIESKRFFSICLLKFEGSSREAYHNHAFNSISWLLKGNLRETCRDGSGVYRQYWYNPSLKPIITTRDNLHKVDSAGTTWVLTFRGPWANKWKEYLPDADEIITLTHGRKRIPNENPINVGSPS